MVAPATNRTCELTAEAAAHPFADAVPALELGRAVIHALRTAVDFSEPPNASFLRVLRYAYVEAVEQLGGKLGTLWDR